MLGKTDGSRAFISENFRTFDRDENRGRLQIFWNYSFDFCRSKSNEFLFISMTFFRTLITFSLGVYTGIYASQNYEVPKMESPKELYERLAAYLSSHKKKND